MKKYFMVIDAGTGSGRVILFDKAGSLIASSSQEWHYDNSSDILGATSFDPELFFNIIAKCVKKTIDDSGINPRDIVSVSTTSQREGMVYLNSEGQEIYSAPNIDFRGLYVVHLLQDREKEIATITGLPLHLMFGLSRLLWFKHNDTKIYKDIHKALMICDWIAYRLCGCTATEPSVACSSQMLDVEKRTFAVELLDCLELRNDIFPPIVSAGETIGFVTETASKVTGLPQGVPVSIGGADTQAGVIGVGSMVPGDISVIAGTSSPVMAVMDSATRDKNNCFYTICHAIPERWLMGCDSGYTGLAHRWLKDLLLSSMKDVEDPYVYMEREASRLPIGAEGMNAYLGMEIAGQTNQTLGGFVFPVPWNIELITPAHFYRAAIETNIYVVAANIKLLLSTTGFKPDCIRIGGGQTKSAMFAQGLSDLIDIPVKVFCVKEASALGSAILAASKLDIYGSVEVAMEHMLHEEKEYTPNHDKSLEINSAYNNWRDVYKYLCAHGSN